MATAFIRDNYTASGYIAAVERLYPAVKLQYRPILVIDRDNLTDALAKFPQAGDANKLAADAMARRIVSWDIVDDQGKAVAVSHANLLRLQPVLFNELLGLIMGRRPSDPEPAAASNPDEMGLKAQLLGQAAAEGTRPEDLLEAKDAGNSPAG